MSRRRVPALVTALIAAMLMLGPLTATLAGPTPGGYHWARQQSRFTLQVGDNVDGPWDGILKHAADDWSQSGTVSFRIVAGQTGAQACRPVTGRVEVCNWRYGTQEGWLGLTQLFFAQDGEHIEAATVQMNDSFFDTANEYNNEAARQHTMCHELGHTPGLDHIETTSCMNDSQFAVFNQVVPINKDFNQLAQIYQHEDATTTVAGEPGRDARDTKGTPDTPKNDKNDKKNKKGKHGKGKHGKNDRRHQHTGAEGLSSESASVETLPDGRMVVTFVTWAGEREPVPAP